MPPLIASLFYVLLTVFLFWRNDLRKKPNVTAALWLPIIWVFISGTRFVTQWLETFGVSVNGGTYEEGSLLDAIFFGVMTLLAFRVLVRRGVTLDVFARYNRWVFFYVIFCLLACAWSDYPFVAFKRWIKLTGQIAMVLVVLTEPDPHEAVLRLFKRFGYVLIPLSVLFIKYFPDWGCVYDQWSGESGNSGITLDKNAMGYDCMWISIVLCWQLAKVWDQPKSRARNWELATEFIFLVASLALLQAAHSSTALVCALAGCGVILWLGLKWVKPQRITIYLVVAALSAFVAEYFFNFTTFFITQILHKNMTLTDRTLIWDALLHFDINPIIGTGYESFWLGDRREEMWKLFPNLFLNSAHNGYLQAYLDMGLLGLGVSLLLVFGAYRQTLRTISEDFHFARLRLAFVIAFVFYNWTEVAFRTHCVPFFGFLLGAMAYPNLRNNENKRTDSLVTTDDENIG